MPRLEPPRLVIIFFELFQNHQFFCWSIPKKPGIFGILFLFFFGGGVKKTCSMIQLPTVGPYRPQLLWNLGGHHARLAYSVVDGGSWEWCNKQRDDGQLPGRTWLWECCKKMVVSPGDSNLDLYIQKTLEVININLWKGPKKRSLWITWSFGILKH